MEALELPGFWILLKIWTWIRDFVLSLACPSLIPDTDKFGAKIKATWEIPGPTIWRPVLGDALTLNKFGGPEKLLDYISSLHEKYGPIFKTKLGPQKFVFINHPALYEEIFRPEPNYPIRLKLPSSEAFYEKHKIDRGIFCRDGKEFCRGRTIMAEVLLKVAGQYMETLFDSVDPVLKRLMDHWTTMSMETKGGHIRNIEQDCYEFFIAAKMTMTYGQHYETFLSQAGSSVKTLASEAIKLNAATFDLNTHPIQIATGFGLKEYDEYTLKNLETGRKCIDIALETMAATGGSSEEFGLLHRIKNVYNASDEEMRVYFTDMTADISDQVSLTFLWILFSLGRNPDVQEKILQEIEQVCRPGKNVVYKDLQKLPYLNTTCKEVFRLFSTAQLVIRKNSNDVVLGGYNVTADYAVILSSFSSHKNPSFFSNPEKFWPGRWLGEERDVDTGEVKRSENAYYPFGMGKRMCAGKLLAYNLMKLFIAKVVQAFVVESDEVQKKLKIMLYPNGDMNIRLKSR